MQISPDKTIDDTDSLPFKYAEGNSKDQRYIFDYTLSKLVISDDYRFT